MTLVRVWRRQLMGGMSAAVIVPAALLASLVALAFAGGFGGLTALGQALSQALRADGSRRQGAAVVPADEALASVALEASGRPLVVSNVDLSDMGVGGLATDLVARFLNELAEGGGLTLHVRLIEGRDTQHVLEAIFKALGVALAQGCRARP